jgi:hypothetical protein
MAWCLIKYSDIFSPWEIKVLVPVRTTQFCLLLFVQTEYGTHPDVNGGSVSWRYHSLPSCAKTKNAWSYASTPPTRIHGHGLELN